MTATANTTAITIVNATVIMTVSDVTATVPTAVNVSGELYLDAVTVHHNYHVEGVLQQIEGIEIAAARDTALFAVIIHDLVPNLKVNLNLNQSRAVKVHPILNQVHLHRSLTAVLNQKVIRLPNLVAEVEVTVNLVVEVEAVVIVKAVVRHQVAAEAKVRAVAEAEARAIAQE